MFQEIIFDKILKNDHENVCESVGFTNVAQAYQFTKKLNPR